jgi:hypothetical protein
MQKTISPKLPPRPHFPPSHFQSLEDCEEYLQDHLDHHTSRCMGLIMVYNQKMPRILKAVCPERMELAQSQVNFDLYCKLAVHPIDRILDIVNSRYGVGMPHKYERLKNSIYSYSYEISYTNQDRKWVRFLAKRDTVLRHIDTVRGRIVVFLILILEVGEPSDILTARIPKFYDSEKRYRILETESKELHFKGGQFLKRMIGLNNRQQKLTKLLSKQEDYHSIKVELDFPTTDSVRKAVKRIQENKYRKVFGEDITAVEASRFLKRVEELN